MRTLVMGDSHGAYKAFLQVMDRSNFDYENDRLICLGDVSDGWPEVPELIEELLKIKHLVWVRGNHDQWLKDFLKEGKQPDVWTLQGGEVARKAYLFRHPELREKHLQALKNTFFYYVDTENRLYVHGGYEPGVHPQSTIDNKAKNGQDGKMYLMWDRQLWDNSRRSDMKRRLCLDDFKEVYVGHTSIYHLGYHEPVERNKVWFMDTGGGWEGVLSVMDVDTKEVWQSDLVSSLYPEVRGRN